MVSSPRIISILNQKGGVAKTTTTANIGACLAARGCRTLLIDMDPQANLSMGLGVKVSPGKVGLHDLLQRKAGVRLEQIVLPVEGLPLFLAPASFELSQAEAILTPVLGSGYRLRQALERYSDFADYVLIDCPPSLGRLTEMAIVASSHLLIPTEPKLYSFAGMDTLNRMFKSLEEDLNLDVKLLGVLLTMFEKRTRLHRMFADEIREQFGENVFDTVIRRTVRISESELEGRPAILLDPSSTGAQDYSAVTDEVLKRLSIVSQPKPEPVETIETVETYRAPYAAPRFPPITTPPDVMAEQSFLEEITLRPWDSNPKFGNGHASAVVQSRSATIQILEPDSTDRSRLDAYHPDSDTEQRRADPNKRSPLAARFGSYLNEFARKLTHKR